jgi:hypothetical protein
MNERFDHWMCFSHADYATLSSNTDFLDRRIKDRDPFHTSMPKNPISLFNG